MIDKIQFTNYKSFKETQNLLLNPITVIIGKNSSGKSAIAKVPTLIECSLGGKYFEPIDVYNEGIDLGAEFRDLIYGREIGSLEFELYENKNKLSVEVTSGVKDTDQAKIRKWCFNNELFLSYKATSDKYLNESSNTEHDVEFKGFNLISDTFGEKYIGQLLHLKTNYIGPFREIPRRNYNVKGSSETLKIGTKGENTYQILINDFLYNQSQLLNEVNNWFIENFDGWGIKVNSKTKPDYKIELFRNTPEFSINIVDVGEGMSQVLPLVVSAFMNDDKEVLTIMEQPELHLHPAAHGNLAELFATSAKKSKNKFLIETHSQNFILRLRRMIAENKLSPDDVGLYFVDYDVESNKSELIQININNKGGVDYWPENIFSETLTETIAIRNAQKSIKL